MTIQTRLKSHFHESIKTKQAVLNTSMETILSAHEILLNCLLNNHTILCCGNGGSAADAQHFAAEMLNQFEMKRPSLAAIALTTDTSTLTAIANDEHFKHIFSKQIQALGKPGDTLLAISTSGNSENITKAIQAAHQADMTVVALTGKTGGEVAQMLNEKDVEIRIPSHSTARIQEAHILILHCFCDLIDWRLFGHVPDNLEDAYEAKTKMA